MSADAERNASAEDIDVPLLFLRGDADGMSPDEYVEGLRQRGARHVTGGVLPASGELAPLEAPRVFTEQLRAFARASAEKARRFEGNRSTLYSGL
jgi:pimeloyl-ACP methyl ester carboxylesterase